MGTAPMDLTNFYLASFVLSGPFCLPLYQRSEIPMPKGRFCSIMSRGVKNLKNERIRDMKQVFSLQQLNLKRSIRLNRVLGSVSLIQLKMNPPKSLTPSILMLPTFEHRSMRKKCLVLPLKTSIP